MTAGSRASIYKIERGINLMSDRFSEQEIKNLVKKVAELHSRFPNLDDPMLSEVFLTENRATLNRRELNSARKVTEIVMARWRRENPIE